MANYRFLSIWQAKRAKGTFINWHSHNCYELVYYTQGAGTTLLDNASCAFGANTFAIIPCGTPHQETHTQNGGVICLTFSWERPLPLGLYTDTDLSVLRLLQDLLREVKSQDLHYEQMLALKLEELTLLLRRLQSNKTDQKNFDFILNLLRTQFHENIHLTDCARQLNLSYDYFQHKFKSIVGRSPQQFLIDQRLTAAEQLLKSGDYSCTQIAYRCGFSTSAQFSGMFKKRYGVSPLQYKKQA